MCTYGLVMNQPGHNSTCKGGQCKGKNDDLWVNLLLLLFFDPGTQFPGNKIIIIFLPSVSRIPKDLEKIEIKNCRSDRYSGQSSGTNES